MIRKKLRGVNMNKHLTGEEIEQYIDSEYLHVLKEVELSEDDENLHLSTLKTEEILKIEEHLLKCDTCLEKVTKALDFSLSFYQWLEESPSAEQKMLLRILKASQSEESDVKKRILNWMKDWQTFVDNTVDVFLDTTYKGLSNITKLIAKDTMTKETKWSFKYPIESFAMRGNPNLNFEKKVENKLYGQIGGKDILEIKAQSKDKKITINCKNIDNTDSSPIFLLLPLTGGDPIIKLARQIKNEDDYEISIEGIHPGHYLLAIEPDHNQ